MMIPVPSSGRFDGVDGTDEALGVEHITELDITVPVGRTIAAWPQGDRYLGFLFARADEPEHVERALRRPTRTFPSASRRAPRRESRPFDLDLRVRRATARTRGGRRAVARGGTRPADGGSRDRTIRRHRSRLAGLGRLLGADAHCAAARARRRAPVSLKNAPTSRRASSAFMPMRRAYRARIDPATSTSRATRSRRSRTGSMRSSRLRT